MELSTRVALTITLLFAVRVFAQSETSIVLSSADSGRVAATAKHAQAVEVLDFENTDASGGEVSKDVCYRGKSKDVEAILQKIADSSVHWSLKRSELITPFENDSEWVKAIFADRDHDDVRIVTTIHACR